MESQLNCTVCGNEYRTDNLPRLLTTCGHTYCEKCLDTMMAEDEEGRHRVSCPEDQIVTYLDGCDVTQFPKNIALLKVIEGKKSQIVGSFKDESLQITKIQRREDSRGDETEQDIINQIESGKEASLSREQTSSKEEIKRQIAPKKEQYQLCLPHQKPMDVVCLEDMIKICAKCAIFGQHKGHEFKSIENIQEEWNAYRQDIMNIYSRKESLEKLISNQESTKYILSIFDQSKKKLQKDLTQRFKKLKEAVKRMQQSTIKSLEDISAKAEDRVRNILKLDPLLANEYQAWEDRSFGLIIQTQQCNLQEKLKILYDYNNNRLVTQGQLILDKIKEQEVNIPNRVQKIIKSITLEFKDDALIALQSYAKVIESKQQIDANQQNYKMKARSPLSFQESLLENEHIQHKPETSIIYSIPTYEPPKLVQQIFKMQNTLNSFNNNSPPFSKQRNSFYSQESVQNYIPQKTERPPKKKLKLIKVTQKIEKTLQLLYNDTLDLLDLTNAELGDSTILQICEFLRGTKVRVVKFIRNKLTDDVIPKMIPALANIITLYLSQNLLTEQAIEYLITYRNSMPYLKSVILSQNKIIERKHKAHIERLRKLDLTVSI